MTDTISRSLRRAGRASARPGLLRAGLPAAAWAAVAGLVALAVPVLLVWAADSRADAGPGAALRAVAQVWLLAHGGTVTSPGGPLGLTPLALFALPLLLLERAARHAATEHEVTALGEAARLTAGVAGPYALAVTVVAGLVGDGGVGALSALLGASALGLSGGAVGVARGAGLGPVLLEAVPSVLRRAARPAAVALVALLGAGGLLAGLATASDLGGATELAAASSPGLVGGLALLVVGLLLVPTAAVWGAAWLAGPGFTVGVGTAVGPLGVSLGAVPALPLLAGLPDNPPPLLLGVLALAVPVGAGVLAGRTARRIRAGRAATLLTGPLVGLAMAGLAALSSGPLGRARLSEVGPSWWQVGLAVTVEVGVGIAAVGAVRRLRSHRSGSRP